MPVVEKTGGGRVNVRGIGEFVPGDRAEVSQGDAEYLLEDRDDFELVQNDETDAEPDAEDDGEGASNYEERTALAESLATENWQTVVSAIEDGEADAYLDELAQADDRDSVRNAINERRSELEG